MSVNSGSSWDNLVAKCISLPRPQNIFGVCRTFFSAPVARPKVSFCPARPNTASDAPCPSPLHMGRFGRAGQSEKRGWEWRARRVTDTRTTPNRLLPCDGVIIGAQRRCSCREGEPPMWQPRRSTREPPDWSANSAEEQPHPSSIYAPPFIPAQ